MNSGPILPGTRYGTAGRRRSFAWSHLLLRLIWNITWFFLASWTPPQLYAWRRLLLNLFGAKIAKGARVYGSARIWYPPNLVMEAGSVLGWRSFAYTQDRIVIGEHAIISQFSMLVTGTHDVDSETFQLFTKPIHIGSHAWIAANTFVGPGVTVGEGAVLGGAGVAFRNLEPWTIYGGNPAQKIRERRRFIEDVGSSNNGDRI